MRIKLLLLLAAVFFVASSSNLCAQTNGKKREVGVQFGSLNFNSFNALYRKQKSENVYRRIRATFGNLGYASTEDETNLRFNAGLAIGREKRKTLDRKLEFYRGPEVNVGLDIIIGDTDGRFGVNAGFGYVLGLQHSFSDLWAIHLETIPSIGARFRIGDNSQSDIFTVDAGFSSAVSLGVVRKF